MNAVALFVKYPEAGRVKTRLAREIGTENALAAYRWLAARAVGSLPDNDARFAWFDPAERADDVRAWLEGLRAGWAGMIAQPPIDLGGRMAAAADALFARGFAKVALVGADCPDLRPAHFAAAWDALERADVVFGPAADGGYYLVGLRAPHRGIFEGVNWSSAETLGESLERASALGLKVELLETLRDIDTAADWRAVESAPPFTAL